MFCYDLEEWDVEDGMKELQEGGDICILMADSVCYTAETNMIF